MGIKQLAFIFAAVFLIAVGMAFIGGELPNWIADIWDAAWTYIKDFLV